MPDPPTPFSHLQLIRGASFNNADWQQINLCRSTHNRFGFAYQIAFVRLMGRFPRQAPLEINGEIVTFTSLQFDLNVQTIDGYKKRRQTISEHQKRIREYLKMRTFDKVAERELATHIAQEALRLDRLASLVAKARQWCRAGRFLMPADYAIYRIAQTERRKARDLLGKRMMQRLSPAMRSTLDVLLMTGDNASVSPLQRIKSTPSKPSNSAMVQLMGKLDLIEETGLIGVEINWVNPNYQRILYHHVRTASADKLRDMPASRRYLAMACYLHQAWHDSIDQAVDMYGKLLERQKGQVDRLLDDKLKDQRRTIDRVVQNYTVLSAILLDPTINDADLRHCILTAISVDELRQDQSSFVHWTKGDSKAKFTELSTRHGSLHRFAAPFLTRLAFVDDQKDKPSPTLQAVKLYQQIRKTPRRTLPHGTQTEFAPKGIKALIEKDGTVDRARWESALFLKVRDEISSGNLAIEGAKNFGRFEQFFLPPKDWENTAQAFWKQTGFPANAEGAAQMLRTRLNSAFDQFLSTIPDNKKVVFKDDGWRLKNDPGESVTGEKAKELADMRHWLDNHKRSIRLADLLIEVDNDLGFTSHFRSPNGIDTDGPQRVCAFLATILAHGCNLGLHTMEKITQGISYKQLKRVSDWHLTEENQRTALATIVRGISSLDAPKHWGDGTTSASDGQRFAMPHKVLQQTYSTKFNDFALEFYSFVADNYAPFYSRPIECTNRDAPFVLDGMLYHESGLDFEEHFTDTHGYTEINFSAFFMIGKRFCPRIRNLHHQRIYCADAKRDYGPLEPVLKRGKRAINFDLIAEQWQRIGQFYAAFPAGHTTASSALQRLNRFKSTNRFYAANRELGRLLKTEFLLKYMSEPQLRARIRKGLLKVEQLHALARAVYYGQRGRVSSRELHDQINSCSCLTLILACIIYWQAREISKLIALPEFKTDPRLVGHISPIEWKNIVLYGEYRLDPNKIKIRSP